MALTDIIDIQISVGAVTPTRQSFGLPCALAYHTVFPEQFRLYGSPTDMISDGFTANDPAYKLAVSIFNQSPRPPQVLVARVMTPPSAPTYELDVTGIVAGQSVTFTLVDVVGNVVDFSVPFNTDEATTAADLATALDAVTGLNASSAAAVCTAISTTADLFFFRDVQNATFQNESPSWNYDTELSNLALATDGTDAAFYGVVIDNNSDINVAETAAWALANKRLAGFSPQVTDPNDYSAATTLFAALNNRAYSVISRASEEEYLAAALMGNMFARDPGSATWKFKQLAGGSPTAWSATDRSTIFATNTSLYQAKSGINITEKGLAHGGQFVDIIRGTDALEASIAARVFGVLANAPKVPFTDAGGDLLANEVQAELTAFEDSGFLVPGSSATTFTPVASQSPADKAIRRFNKITFESTLAGAVHEVVIRGTLNL